MDVIYILIPLSVLFLLIAILFFFWAVNNDQYENFDSSSYHIIFDDIKKNKNNDLT